MHDSTIENIINLYRQLHTLSTEDLKLDELSQGNHDWKAQQMLPPPRSASFEHGDDEDDEPSSSRVRKKRKGPPNPAPKVSIRRYIDTLIQETLIFPNGGHTLHCKICARMNSYTKPTASNVT